MFSKAKETSGFTLMEIVIVIVIIGILAVVAVPKLAGFLTSSKIESTSGEMMTLKDAMVSEMGYVVDVGSSPPNLQALVTRPAGVAAYDRYAEVGWNGPYINDDGSESYLFDAWDNAYVLTATTITSYGPNGVSGGGDDIILNY